MLLGASIEGVVPGRAPLRAAASLCGSLVRDRDGEVAGSITELMVDLERGCVAYAIVASGGFLGVGERRFAVPWSALRSDARQFVLCVTRAALESGPTLEAEQWLTGPARAWHERVHAHFGARPYWQ